MFCEYPCRILFPKTAVFGKMPLNALNRIWRKCERFNSVGVALCIVAGKVRTGGTKKWRSSKTAIGWRRCVCEKNKQFLTKALQKFYSVLFLFLFLSFSFIVLFYFFLLYIFFYFFHFFFLLLFFLFIFFFILIFFSIFHAK